MTKICEERGGEFVVTSPHRPNRFCSVPCKNLGFARSWQHKGEQHHMSKGEDASPSAVHRLTRLE